MDRGVNIQLSEQSPHPVDEGSLFVTGATLRLMLWRDMVVRAATVRGLTPLEQFVLEAAIALGTVTESQFTDITGLPADLLHTLARRLVNSGALTKGESAYRSVPGTAQAALDRHAVITERTRQANFIYLPGTDDLLAIDAAAAHDLHGALRSSRYRLGAAPLPSALINKTRGEIVAAHLRQGTVNNLPDDVVAVVQDDDDDLVAPSRSCSAYRCTAILSRHDMSVTMTLQAGASGDDGEHRPAPSFRFAGNSNVATQWLRLSDLPEHPAARRRLWNAVAGNTPQSGATVTRTSVSRWRYNISGLTAEKITSSARNLSFDAAVDVIGDDVRAQLVVSFAAADAYAERLIAIDATIAIAHRAHNDPQPLLDLVDDACRSNAARPRTVVFDSLLARIWSLGHYQLAYALTEHLDFAYD